MQYFVVMIDYGRRGREAIVDPEITRREVISRVASGEYKNISFIHEIADSAVNDITAEIMAQALAQARDGRLHILAEMNKSLSAPAGFSEYAPKIETLTIPTDKIREVIGSGGKVIREIVELSGAKVDINDDGMIKIASNDAAAIKRAYDMIWSIDRG